MPESLRVRIQFLEVSQDAKRDAGVLAAFAATLSRQRAQVGGLIGGTATGADREIIQILDAAGRSLERATQTLQQAAQACAACADRL
jgi:hypothetical protein